MFDADIRVAMQEKSKELIVASYGAFLKRYQDLDFAPNKEKYLVYSQKQVAQMLGSILQGSSWRIKTQLN